MNAHRQLGKAFHEARLHAHRVTYDLTVEGTFYQLLRYVNLLENEGRFINVESFQVTPGSESSGSEDSFGGTPSRGMSLRLYSFTYKPLKPQMPFIDASTRKLGVSTPPPE